MAQIVLGYPSAAGHEFSFVFCAAFVSFAFFLLFSAFFLPHALSASRAPILPTPPLQIGYVIFVQWKPVRHSVNSNDVISSAEAATAAFPCEPCPAPAPCLAVAAPKRSMVPVTDSYFCPKAISDPAAWMCVMRVLSLIEAVL